jgi:hypothetical protein
MNHASSCANARPASARARSDALKTSSARVPSDPRASPSRIASTLARANLARDRISRANSPAHARPGRRAARHGASHARARHVGQRRLARIVHHKVPSLSPRSRVDVPRAARGAWLCVGVDTDAAVVEKLTLARANAIGITVVGV